jgi:hypothetical protein
MLFPSELTPPFLCAPLSSRTKIYTWARNAFIVLLAATIPPFTDLPDDCAGDILEYIPMSISRQDALHVVAHCSSLEARAWVRTVLASAVAVSTRCTCFLICVAWSMALIFFSFIFGPEGVGDF